MQQENNFLFIFSRTRGQNQFYDVFISFFKQKILQNSSLLMVYAAVYSCWPCVQTTKVTMMMFKLPKLLCHFLMMFEVFEVLDDWRTLSILLCLLRKIYSYKCQVTNIYCWKFYLRVLVQFICNISCINFYRL